MSSLSILREALLKGKHVEVDNELNRLVIGKGESAFPLSAKTNFKASAGKSGFYSIGSVYFLYEQRDKPHSEYIGRCVREKVDKVSILDRKDLLQFLKGELETSRKIVSVMEAPSVEKTGITGDIMVEDTHRDEFDIFRNCTDFKAHFAPEDVKRGRIVLKNRVETLFEEYKYSFGGKESFTDILGRGADNLKGIDSFLSEATDMSKIIWGEEYSVSTRDSLLKNPKQKDFQYILVEMEEERNKEEKIMRSEKKRKAGEQSQWSRTLGTGKGDSLAEKLNKGGSFLGESRSKKRSRVSGSQKRMLKPIIVVPTAATSLITMQNAKDFLEDGLFHPKGSKSRMRGELSRFERKSSSSASEGWSEYEIVDTTTKLGESDWERVVSVFVTGKKWQFAMWPWKNPPEVFSRIAGFFLCYTGDELPVAVANWNVTVLRVDKTKRHLDLVAHGEYWKTIDQTVAQRRLDVKF